jgi:hypothetical protein
MGLNLHLNARPDERFYLQVGPPHLAAHFDWGWLRRTHWHCVDRSFTSWWFFGCLQWYHGSAKCDGTRTRMYWAGMLTDTPEGYYKPDMNLYVMTMTPSELLALRWRRTGPGEPTWDGMGGS